MISDLLVSVIIPAYNRLDYIDQTINSVLNQTYSNVEIIVVDDASTDGTFEKLQSYGNKIKLLTHEGHVNKGQSASINLGLKQVSGNYISILDSDDFWDTEKLSVQVKFLKENSDVGLVYCNGYGVDENGNVTYPHYPNDHAEKNDPNLVLLDCYILLPLSTLVRKSVFDQAGFFNEEYRAAQDHDMLLRISELTKLAYLPNQHFFYRRHDKSISFTQQELRWGNGFKILESAINRYPYKKFAIRKRKAVLYYRLGICHYKNDKKSKALWNMLMAFIMDPLRAIKVVLGVEKRK